MAVELICVGCGAKFTRAPSRSGQMFCSRQCKDSSLVAASTVPCDVCGVGVYRPPSRPYARAFCSGACKSKGQTPDHNTDSHRRCRVCSKVLPLEAFNVDKSSKHGRGYSCLPCGAAQLKQRRLTKPLTKEQRLRANATVARWREQNRDRHRAGSREWARRNRDKVAANAARWRATVAGAHGPGLSEIDWREILEIFDYRCAYCLKKLTEACREHFMPVSRGGADGPENVVPACRSCNSSKSNDLISEWVPRLVG